MSDRTDARPRLAFFRWAARDLPGFIDRHLREQVACLSQFFDVTLVDEDCDYAEVCDRVEPDLALFESGVYNRARKITSTSANPSIPKVGFLNSDAYCVTRSVFLSEMDAWGIDTFFTLSLAMAEYTPEIADRLFVWPNFADTDLYRDYGEPKRLPVLLTGSQAVHYPWRNRVGERLAEAFPTMTLPHQGWFDQRATSGMTHGEPYARLLNSALVVPTCGTIAAELVRKHLEIPAAGACLVTQRTAAVEAAGFVDMENCVFADADDVVDKVRHLLADPAALQRLTDAGRELVTARHAMARRDQLRQWFDANRTLGPGERIVQPGPFEPLEVRAAGSGNGFVVSRTPDRELLRRALVEVEQGDLDQAEELLLRCLTYHYMPEPILLLARIRLLRGDPAAAREWICRPIERTLAGHFAPDPDPVEWAYLVRSALCQGDVAEAADLLGRFPQLRHRELDRIRAVLRSLGAGIEDPAPDDRGDRPSVHAMPASTDAEWQAELCRMLTAAGANELADRIGGRPGPAPRAGRSRQRPLRRVLAGSPRGRLVRKVQRVVDARVEQARAGSVPGQLSALLSKTEVSTVAFLGIGARDPAAAAMLAAARRNPNRPRVLWWGDPLPPRRTLDRMLYRGSSTGMGEGATGLDPTLAEGRPAVVVVGAATSIRSVGRLGDPDVIVLVGTGAALRELDVELAWSSDHAVLAEGTWRHGALRAYRRRRR